MPTCFRHGSGGQANREYGLLRYLAWVVTGGPQNTPIELACTLALATILETVLRQGKGTLDQQIKAAMWLTELQSA